MVTTSEQEIRNAAMQKARALYITTGVTMNITEAVRLYWKDHPEECARIRARITTREVDRSPTILDEYERPKCRKCGAPMFWQGSCRACKGPVKKNVWICKRCGFKRFTKDTLEKAISKLERRHDG